VKVPKKILNAVAFSRKASVRDHEHGCEAGMVGRPRSRTAPMRLLRRAKQIDQAVTGVVRAAAMRSLTPPVVSENAFSTRGGGEMRLTGHSSP
jgi:hypothetical protein